MIEGSVLQLLIGKDALRAMGADISFADDTFKSEKLGISPKRLNETDGGHYAMPIFPRDGWKPPSTTTGTTSDVVFRVRSKVQEALMTVRS